MIMQFSFFFEYLEVQTQKHSVKFIFYEKEIHPNIFGTQHFHLKDLSLNQQHIGMVMQFLRSNHGKQHR